LLPGSVSFHGQITPPSGDSGLPGAGQRSWSRLPKGRYGREQESEVGLIAIIAQDDATFEQACQFARVGELVRPIRVFREWHEGRRWIDAIVIDRVKATE
jgi:hypothetical protein